MAVYKKRSKNSILEKKQIKMLTIKQFKIEKSFTSDITRRSE